MKKFLSFLAAALYTVLFPFFCISSTFDPGYGKYFGGYFGPHSFKYVFCRYIVIILLIFLLTFLNRKNGAVFTVCLPLGLLLVTAAAYFDYFYCHHFLYNFSYAVWLLASVSVACAALFVSAAVFLKFDFKKFYRRFWAVYTIVYILIFYVSFIRPENSFALSVNTALGHGTIKYFSYIVRNPADGYMVLICLGNIFVFLPLPFILKNISFKIKNFLILIIGMALPLFVEGYQYVFKCGNVDIDDVVLNWSGLFLGMIIMNIVFKTKFKYEKKQNKRKRRPNSL